MIVIVDVIISIFGVVDIIVNPVFLIVYLFCTAAFVLYSWEVGVV